MLEDIIRGIMNMPPSKRKIAADLALIEKETRDWRRSVIPWETENEIELFSYNNQHKWIKHRGEKLLKGVFYSIYNEPMMTFGYKNYLKRGVHAILWVATDDHVFMYRGDGKRTDFYIDGQAVGYISPEFLMYGGSKNRLLARRASFSDSHYSIVVWDNETGHLLKPRRIDRVNPRAFEMVGDLNENELLLFLSLSFLTIVTESFNLEI